MKRSMNRKENLCPLFFHQTCTDHHVKMICLETQHFNINRILLLIIGLWPYQRSFLINLQLILLFGTLITFIVFQVRILCITKSYYIDNSKSIIIYQALF